MEIAQVSVVVVSFNSANCLATCIENILASRDISVEVIVVDNASRDQSVGVTQELAAQDTRIRIVAHGENLGFAAACNRGAAIARYPLLLFLNPDCFVEPDALALTVDALRACPEAAAGGALVLNPDGRPQRGCRRRLPNPARAFHRLSGLSRWSRGRFQDFNQETEPVAEQPQPVEAISGSYLMIRRSDFDHVGGWDEGYFLHCEDLDLCQRLADAGRQILFVSKARATHLQGASSRRTPVRVEWHKHRGMWRFYRKFQARRYGFWMSVLVSVGIAAHFLQRAAQSLRARQQ